MPDYPHIKQAAPEEWERWEKWCDADLPRTGSDAITHELSDALLDALEEALGDIEAERKQLSDYITLAFEAHPNLDLDVDRAARDRKDAP